MTATITTTTRTSRVGRKPVSVPSGVDVKIDGDKIAIKGPNGQLSTVIHPFVTVVLDDGAIVVSSKEGIKDNLTGGDIKLYKAITGTVRANINNIVLGVTKGFEKRLKLVGVGYRAQCKGKVLALSLGFSHPTDYSIPEGVTIETPKPTEVIIKGASKETVGQVAAEIRAIRKPERYKGKGVRYADEHVELKETKKK